MADNKRKRCSGCYNEIYWGWQGDSTYKCWSFETAKKVRRAFVHVDSVPPWHAPIEKTLSCHTRQRFVAIEPDSPQLAKRKSKRATGGTNG